MAGVYNPTTVKGDTFRLNFTVATDGVNWNFTGYTAKFEVRQSASSSTLVASAYTGDGITMNSSGYVQIVIPAADMDIPVGKYSYDFEVTSAGNEVTTLLSGKLIVEPSVTA